MATIMIKDLVDSTELDQEAMSVIYGGARSTHAAATRKLELRAKKKNSLLDHARENQRRLTF